MLSQKSIDGLKFIVLILLTLAVYYPAMDAQFIIDDNKFFVEDPLMTAPDGLIRIWFSPADNNHVWPYLPMTRTTFWIERQFTDFNPQVSHWINIIFHLISAVFLWLVLKQWLKQGAWWIGLLFAVHPVYVQSVAWIAERKNVVAAVFYILCLWSYLQFEKKRLKTWYALALVLFLCALLSKTSVVMLPKMEARPDPPCSASSSEIVPPDASGRLSPKSPSTSMLLSESAPNMREEPE